MAIRFAPSPTGRLHVGNLRTAWVAGRIARELKLPLVVRFEDIDRDRVVKGAREQQRTDMEMLGIEISQEFLQSENREQHWRAFLRALREGRIYPCSCSREEVRRALDGLASAPHERELHYSGHCRRGIEQGKSPLKNLNHPTVAWRFRQDVGDGREDFIVARSGAPSGRSENSLDWIQEFSWTEECSPDPSAWTPAYHWACAWDDWQGEYRYLVRAWDLEMASFPQRALQHYWQTWEQTTRELPHLFHATLVTQEGGQRLEKRTRGVTLPELELQGVSPRELVEIFEASLEPPDFQGLHLNEDGGERQRTRTLHSLSARLSG